MIIHMFNDSIYIYLLLIIIGLCFGSFAGASLWRLRARQLAQDKTDGEEINQKEYDQIKKLTKRSIFHDRSSCLRCSYILKWYDLIPVFSWLSLSGRCRKCRKPIGYFEPLIELGVALFFVLSYIFWPYSITDGVSFIHFALWLIDGIVLAILFAYDKKWFILPFQLNLGAIIIGAINSLLIFFSAPNDNKISTLLSIMGAVMILSGLYWALGKISKGKWIGGGDVWLGLGLALMLADWRLSFIALFLANFIGCLIVVPGMFFGKLNLKSHVPFGPLLISGYVIAGLFGNLLINIYISSLL
jgi:prepilin signal peptidase PulO-like enzyme (type II secretory pathway)